MMAGTRGKNRRDRHDKAARVIACTGLQGRQTDFVDHWEFQHVYDDATHTVLSSVGAIIAYTFRWIRDMY